MEDIKIYYPSELQDTEIGTDTGLSSNITSTKENSVVESINTVSDSNIQISRVANEIVGISLDTLKSRILGTYTFSDSGSIQIGKYVSGVSGQIQLTPDGITATNSSGATTFAIDGTTGDATFLGTISAGSIVTGYLSVGSAASDVNSGLTGINADRVSISGSTSFTAGYDPTTKVASTAGTYTSTATEAAAKVKIFPDTSTGIVAYASNGTTEVFKVMVGGTIADPTATGDVQIGNYAGGNGALWDQSETTLKIKGNIEAGTISGVTISGSTFKTASSGQRVEMTANGSKIVIYKSNGTTPYLELDNEQIIFASRSSASSETNAIYYYKSGSNYGFKTRMEGGNWSIDQSPWSP